MEEYLDLEIKVLYITARDKSEAAFIAKDTIESNLAVCANIFDQIESKYMWNNRIKTEKESILILKCTSTKCEKLINRIKKIHSYDLPCILEFTVENGNKEFIDWVNRNG